MTDIVAEIATGLSHSGSEHIDWITFVGSGETTLFSRLGSLIRNLARWAPTRVKASLDSLADRGEIGIVDRLGNRFWCVAGTRFSDLKEQKKPKRMRRGPRPGRGVSA